MTLYNRADFTKARAVRDMRTALAVNCILSPFLLRVSAPPARQNARKIIKKTR